MECATTPDDALDEAEVATTFVAIVKAATKDIGVNMVSEYIHI